MASGIFTLRQVLQGIRQGAWTGNIAPQWVEYLIVAGGGGAAGTGEGSGFASAGGGGAGGLLSGILFVNAGATLTVTVGGGGAGGATGVHGTSGIASVFSTITSTGGGGGGGGSSSDGGSGGGAGGGDNLSVGTHTNPAGQAVTGQGNTGGAAGSTSGTQGSGGGGAGTIGLSGVSGVASGNGGAGMASSITGTVTTYAGGGGGGGNNTDVGGTGGVGGGGSRPTGTQGTGGSGTANTGGGGAGGYATSVNQAGGAGGSGIVIVRYPGSTQFYTGGIVWASASGYVVHWFLSTSTLVPTTPTALTVQPAYPVAIGASYGGGYFAGQIKDGGVIYNLVVAPKASGYVQSGYAWDSTGGGSTTGATSVTNGQTNTATIPAIARYAAAQYVKGLNIGGYTDWYLPSIEELGIAWFNLKPLTNDNYGGASAYPNFTGNVPPYQTVANWPSATIPAQTTVTNFKTGGSEAWAGDHGWTSTETSATQASFLYWGTGVPGYQASSDKTQSGYSVRGFRRVVA